MHFLAIYCHISPNARNVMIIIIIIIIIIKNENIIEWHVYENATGALYIVITNQPQFPANLTI